MLMRFLLPRWVLGLRGRVATLECNMERIMAQIDDLNAALEAIAVDVEATLTHVGELETELRDLQANTPPEVDLSSAIEKATTIRARLESMSQTTGDPLGSPDTTA